MAGRNVKGTLAQGRVSVFCAFTMAKWRTELRRPRRDSQQPGRTPGAAGGSTRPRQGRKGESRQAILPAPPAACPRFTANPVFTPEATIFRPSGPPTGSCDAFLVEEFEKTALKNRGRCLQSAHPLMNSEYPSQVIVGLMLLSLLSVLVIGLMITLFVVRVLDRRKLAQHGMEGPSGENSPAPWSGTVAPWQEVPSRWMAVKSKNLDALEEVLGLRNAKRVPWGSGSLNLTHQTLLISPPIDGWLLIVGPGLPDPSKDVDECYRFVLKVSRAIGHVQFFSLNRPLQHHAWVRAEGASIIRAYAWAGETVWNQGAMTHAERHLGMRCLSYGEIVEFDPHGSQATETNLERLFKLAALWSLDPSSLDQRRLSRADGICGELASLG